MNNMRKDNNRGKSVFKFISALFLSMFLAFLSVMITFGEYPVRSTFFFGFFVLIFFYVSFLIIKSNTIILNKLKQMKVGDDRIHKLKIKTWVFPSIIIGTGSVIIVLLLRIFVSKADNSFDYSEFSHFYNIAESLPIKIFYIAIFAFLLYFLLQIIFISKLKIMKISKVIWLSFLSTIVKILLIMGCGFGGLLLYLFMGGILSLFGLPDIFWS